MKEPCHMCNNAKVDPDLTDNEDLSYHSIGEHEKGYRTMITAGNKKPVHLLFEKWDGKRWGLIGYYKPNYCPNCGRELSEYRK